MKTKMFRIGKSTLAVVLTFMMLVSMLTVGMLTTSAATVDDSSVGASNYYLWYNTASTSENPVNFKQSAKMVSDGNNGYYSDITIPATGGNYWFLVNESSTTATDKMWSNNPNVTSNYSKVSACGSQEWGGYRICRVSVTQANTTIRITMDSSKNIIISEAGSPTPTSSFNLVGNFFDDWVTSTPFVSNKVVLNLPANSTYEFKLYGNSDSKWYGNSGTMTKDNCTNWNFSSSEGASCKITTDKAGDYTFTLVNNTPCISVTYPSEPGPTPSANYYIGGRLQQNWSTSSKTQQFTKVSDHTYKFETNTSVAELSKVWQDSGYTADQYFFIHTGSGIESNTWFSGNGGNGNAFHQNTESNKLTLTKSSDGDTSTDKLIKFADTTDTSSPVTIWLDDTDSNSPKLWYSTGSEPTGYKITDKSKNGKVNVPSTANAGDEVTLTYTPNTGYEFASVSVVGADQTAIEVVDNKFTMPEQDVTVTATFNFNKQKFIENTDALWIDVAPDNASPATLIKWNNYIGTSHSSRTSYYFYVPSSVDMSDVKVYNGFGSVVNLNGVSISANNVNTDTLVLSNGGEYALSGATTEVLKVKQGSTDAMYLYTTSKGKDYPLPTQTDSSLTSKDKVKADGGECITDVNGSLTSTAISSVKGRGNSSWEASYKIFGKYAFNIKLDKATSLLGMTKSKSWCLLANNADEANMRNALAYSLATEVGLPDAPEYRFVDIYDNGEYMGSYIVTEKVDVGSKDKLVNKKSIEELNNDAGIVFNEEASGKKTGNTYKGCSYSYTEVLEGDPNAVDISKGTYLLEFEIGERYHDEQSYFTTPTGQHVTLKSPEFATQREMQFIIDKYLEMENAVFASSNASLESISPYMDLDSFAKMYLIQELSANLDAASTSYYLTYTVSTGKFVASPIWDYDWAFGQYTNSSKKDVNGNILQTDNPEGWVAKNKAMDDSTDSSKGYSIQSKLANNTNFQTVIKKVWNGTGSDGFYEIAKTYCGTQGTRGGNIGDWYNAINASMSMNETRWCFIADNPIKSWGSKDTGANFAETTMYLNNFVYNRLNWLNTKISAWNDYHQFETPVIKAYEADGKTELQGPVTAGDSFVIDTTTDETYVTYNLYREGELVESNTSGKFTITTTTADEGTTKKYTVKTVYGTDTSSPSDELSVEITAQEGEHTVKVMFKSANATVYIPSVSLDGGEAVQMTKTSDSYIGTNQTGSLKFYWYSADVKLNSENKHTLTFTTKGTMMRASISGNFEGNTYKFAVDNLMSGTQVDNLTSLDEYIQNYHLSATHMTSAVYEKGTFGYTWVNGEEVEFATIIDGPDSASVGKKASSSVGAGSSSANFTIDSATKVQTIAAEIGSASVLQTQILDVNLDGATDIRDATIIQRALAFS